MILGLRTAIYPVSDLEQAKAWYTKVLDRPPYFDEPFYVGFTVGGFELGLIPDGQPGVSGPQPLWGVTSADEAFARLVELGGSPDRARHRSRRRDQGRLGPGSVREPVWYHRESSLRSRRGAVSGRCQT